MYVSDDFAHHIININYTHTIHPQVHKILSFTVRHPSPRGQSYWKLNSSIINDPLYVTLIEKIAQNVTASCPPTPQMWWDTFLTAVRSRSVIYCRRKAFIKNNVKKAISEKMHFLESLPKTHLSTSQISSYAHLKERFSEIEEKEIAGHQARTRGFPVFEIKAPDISFYQNLENDKIAKNIEKMGENSIKASILDELLKQ